MLKLNFVLTLLLLILGCAPASKGKAASQSISEETRTPESDETENKILAQVLAHDYEDGGFTVVEPFTSYHSLERGTFDSQVESILRRFRQEPDLRGLVQSFLQQNSQRALLTLTSDPVHGYIVDKGGKFSKYFDKNGGGWEKWHQENPKAHGFATVSLPATHPASNLVLVYIGRQSGWLDGDGFLILYKLEDGKLKEVERTLLWVS